MARGNSKFFSEWCKFWENGLREKQVRLRVASILRKWPARIWILLESGIVFEPRDQKLLRPVPIFALQSVSWPTLGRLPQNLLEWHKSHRFQEKQIWNIWSDCNSWKLLVTWSKTGWRLILRKVKINHSTISSMLLILFYWKSQFDLGPCISSKIYITMIVFYFKNIFQISSHS